MQVVQVDDSAVFVIKDGKAFYDSGLVGVPGRHFLGDVIELTEERVRRHTAGVGWERRLISEWESVDGD